MSIIKQELESIIEREGVMDFIWSRSWEDIEGTEIGLYELANDRWGVVFKIDPPFYASTITESKISDFYGINLPERSSIQFFMHASRNIDNFKNNYDEVHTANSNVKRLDVLKELKENKLEWFETHTKESLYKSKGLDLRLRNYVNLCTVTIPKKSKQGNDIPKSEVINIFSRVYSGLLDFNPRKFNQKEYISLMREILVPDSDIWNTPEDDSRYLHNQVADMNSTITLDPHNGTIGIGKIELENEPEDNENKEDTGILGKIKGMFSSDKKSEVEVTKINWHAKAYTTKTYPSNINLFELLSNFVDFQGSQIETEIPSNFFASLTAYVEEKDRTKKEVISKAQWDTWSTRKVGEEDNFFPTETKKENKKVNSDNYNMSAMWSLVIMDESVDNVQKYGKRIKDKFKEGKWTLQEETIIPHWIFLYSLPLQFEESIMISHSKRFNTIFKREHAGITPVMTGEKGYGDPVLTYVDRAGQLSALDIFSSSTDYNFLVIGSTGSGKAYSMSDFFTNYLMNGAKIRVIDDSNSYYSICKLIGGDFIEIKPTEEVSLNFFTHIQLNEEGNIHEDEIDIIAPLIKTMIETTDKENAIDTDSISEDIIKAIKSAFKSKNRKAGMKEVVTALETLKSDNTDIILTISALNEFADKNGKYYNYFNGKNTLKIENDFTIFDLGELIHDQDLKDIVCAAVLYNINTEFLSRKKLEKNIVMINNYDHVRENTSLLKLIKIMSRRVKKYNGSFGIMSDSILDFTHNEESKEIFNSFATKMYLKQLADTIHVLQSEELLDIEPAIINRMLNVTAKFPLYSEVLIHRDTGDFFIARLITDKLSHWFYTDHMSDIKEIQHISTDFKISHIEARLIKGYSEKNKRTLEEEFNIRLKSGRLKILKENEIEEEYREITAERILEEELDSI